MSHAHARKSKATKNSNQKDYLDLISPMNLICSSLQFPFTSPVIQQPNYKSDHKQRHKAINQKIN